MAMARSPWASIDEHAHLLSICECSRNPAEGVVLRGMVHRGAAGGGEFELTYGGIVGTTPSTC